MSEISGEQLDRIFSALSDSTRRGMLARLAEGSANVSTLAEPYAISQPAASRHVRVLEEAGLVRRERRGREHYITADPLPLEEARGWIGHYARFWRRHFDAVDDWLAERGYPQVTPAGTGSARPSTKEPNS